MAFLSVGFLIVSCFILFQGLSFNGIISAEPLVLEKFTSNNFLQIVRMVLSYHAPIVGVFGIAVGVMLIFYYIKIKESGEKFPFFFMGVFIFYVLFALFIVI